MNIEEAIKDLKEMKSIEYNPEHKAKAIETVLEELDKKDNLMFGIYKEIKKTYPKIEKYKIFNPIENEKNFIYTEERIDPIIYENVVRNIAIILQQYFEKKVEGK